MHAPVHPAQGTEANVYGTIARLRAKAGAEHLIVAQMNALRTNNAEQSARMAGWLSSALHQSARDPRDLFLVVAFEDEAAYRANAALPTQHEWYIRLRGCLEADPEWFDGPVLTHLHQPDH